VPQIAAFIRASIKQKLFIRILTREPICRNGRSLIIYYYYYYYYHHTVRVLPQLSVHRSSFIVIHCSFENCNVVERRSHMNEKFVSRYRQQNTSLRDEIRASSWR